MTTARYHVTGLMRLIRVLFIIKRNLMHLYDQGVTQMASPISHGID